MFCLNRILFSHILRFLRFIGLAALLLTLTSCPPPEPGQWQSQNTECLPSPISLNQTYIDVANDKATIWPDSLAREGSQVNLLGTARRLTITTTCGVETLQLRYNWTLTYREFGGLAKDATSELKSPASLTPNFIPKRGIYIVELHTEDDTHVVQGQTARIRVDAIRTNGWVSVGPDGREPRFSGRVNSIAFNPQDPKIMYAAAARGGVWRSENAGAEWWEMTDHKGIPPTLSIGRLAVSKTGKVYASVGDPENGGYFRAQGNGIYTSTDDGVTWQLSGTDPSCGSGTQTPQGIVSKILIDPNNSDNVFASAYGVYRSTDAGKCWKNILPSVSTSDLALRSSGSGTGLYVALLGKTQIGEAVQQTPNALIDPPVWSPTTDVANPLISPRRILLANSSNVLYALVIEANGSLGFFRLQKNWLKRSEPHDNTGNNRCDGQCAYSSALAANPVDPNDVIVGTVTVLRTRDGGLTWQEYNPGASIFSDQHTLIFNPLNPNFLFAGNDGGLQKIDVNQTSSFWEPLNRGLATGLFEGLALSRAKNTQTVGGLQDGGTRLQNIGRYWKVLRGGDGKRSAFDGDNPDLVYFTNNWAFGYNFSRSTNTVGVGAANNFWADPERHGVLLGLGPSGTPGLELYYTTGVDINPANWTCIDPTPADSSDIISPPDFLSGGGKYIVGSSTGTVYRITVPVNPAIRFPCQGVSAGTSEVLWQAPATTTPNPLARGQVIGVSIDPFAPSESIYITLARYDEWRVTHLQRDSSGIWNGTPIAGTSGMPGSFPKGTPCTDCTSPAGTFVAPIAVDPFTEDKVFVGSENGLLLGTPSQAGTWSWAQEPDVPESWITEVRAERGKGFSGYVLRASSFGRSVFERIPYINIRNITIEHMFPIPWWKFHPADRITDALIKIDYSYKGPEKAILQISAEQNERAVPYLISERSTIESGQGTINLGLLYSGIRAPAWIDTNTLTARLLSMNGKTLETLRLPVALSWKRHDARSLAILAELSSENGEPTPFEISAKISVGNSRSIVKTGASVAFPAKTEVTIELPESIVVSDQIVRFAGWVNENTGLSGSSNHIATRLESDQRVIAQYKLPISRNQGKRKEEQQKE